MVQYCVMVKGPCRGKSCDFWARVKIRKTSVEEILAGIKDAITNCQIENSLQLTEAIQKYWIQLGVRNLERLHEEEPDLWSKMMQIEHLAKRQIRFK